MNNLIVFFGGVVATVLFIIGFSHTIYEFRQMEDERNTAEENKAK
ncbi:hypothetical protein AB2B38_002640 [Balneola sp. MJW-20]